MSSRDDYSRARKELLRRHTDKKDLSKQEIEEWQQRWRDRGPVEFAEHLLTCPMDVPIHPDFDTNNNPVFPCNDDCSIGTEHPKFRDNGIPYHLILSEEQKEFLIDLWKNNITTAILAAARGAGKTFIFGIFNCWKTTTEDHISITCMGGSGEQSELIQDYIDDWRMDIPMIGKIIYKSLKGIRRYAKTLGRSLIKFPPCSTTAARGPHVNIVEIDEACEAESKSEDGAKAVAAVQWQLTGKRCSVLLLSSTVHYIFGKFYDYMKNPEKYGFQKVYRWSIAKHINGETDPYKVYTDKDPTHWIPNVWWVTRKEISDKRKSKSDEEWLCEALGGASMASGAVFKKGDLDVCICSLCENCEPYNWKECKLVKLGELGTEEDSTKYIIDRQSGFDYGYSDSPCSLTVIGRKGDVIFVLFNDEQLGMRDTEKPDWIDSTCKQYKTYTFIPDPNAAGKHLNEPLEEKGYAVYIIAEQEKTVRVSKAINFIERHKIIIPKAFWYLTASLRKLAWDKNGKIRKIDDHSFDSLCYSMDGFEVEESGESIFEEFLKFQVHSPTQIKEGDFFKGVEKTMQNLNESQPETQDNTTIRYVRKGESPFKKEKEE